MKSSWSLLVLCGALATSGCISPFKLAAPMFKSPKEVPNKIKDPVLKDTRLAVLWVGHATALIQIEDKLILTDPVFGTTVGQFSKRIVEPGLDIDDVPKLDAIVISHMHPDHLHQGSVDALDDRTAALFVPEEAHAYMGNLDCPSYELKSWESWEKDGLRITAVPVNHVGMRYGLDSSWMDKSFTGYIIQYKGVTVYFGGDSAWGDHYRKTAERFPTIDLALIPIAPIEPRWFMKRTHVDPPEAVRAFFALKARWMMPIHYDTFVNSQDDPGDALRSLRREMKKNRLGPDRVKILGFGEQRVFMAGSSQKVARSQSL